MFNKIAKKSGGFKKGEMIIWFGYSLNVPKSCYNEQGSLKLLKQGLPITYFDCELTDKLKDIDKV